MELACRTGQGMYTDSATVRRTGRDGRLWAQVAVLAAAGDACVSIALPSGIGSAAHGRPGRPA